MFLAQVADWAEEIGTPQFGISAKDTDIDLVAKTQGTGEYRAIQCKCYQPSAPPALKPKKQLRPHQESAKTNVELGFRGKLIMACGTGKTFTSLKIAEEIAGKDKLVPSLNLLSQTLAEWTHESAV